MDFKKEDPATLYCKSAPLFIVYLYISAIVRHFVCNGPRYIQEELVLQEDWTRKPKAYPIGYFIDIYIYI